MTTIVRKSAAFDEAVNLKFLELMPFLTKSARHAFAGYNYDKQADAVQNVLVWAFENLKRLASNGRLHDAYAGSLARFAIGRHREGRSLGVVTSSGDVMSSYCQKLGRSKVKNYGLAENISDSFESEATATDARYPVDRTVQFKMDFFEGWLQQQTPKNQEIIRLLAMGNSPSEVARKIGMSPATICQYQKRFRASWNEYIADKKEAANEAA
jgi:DNA-directed RNA polymerase specialized sigma24 family protein